MQLLQSRLLQNVQFYCRHTIIFWQQSVFNTVHGKSRLQNTSPAFLGSSVRAFTVNVLIPHMSQIWRTTEPDTASINHRGFSFPYSVGLRPMIIVFAAQRSTDWAYRTGGMVCEKRWCIPSIKAICVPVLATHERTCRQTPPARPYRLMFLETSLPYYYGNHLRIKL